MYVHDDGIGLWRERWRLSVQRVMRQAASGMSCYRPLCPDSDIRLREQAQWRRARVVIDVVAASAMRATRVVRAHDC